MATLRFMCCMMRRRFFMRRLRASVMMYMRTFFQPPAHGERGLRDEHEPL
ncbi:hypothetical protein PYR73_01430 [Acinetobacter soli]|nr:hypothetical protein PYR73_01430 [Acinetobacter soli]